VDDAQPWSNGKVGTTGCSSTAEWQMAVASLGHPGFAAMNVQGFGAGVGRVGPYFEQGNWYRGGAVQMLFITWLYGEQNQVRPMFPRTRRRRTWWPPRACSTWRRRCRRWTGQGALAPAGAGHPEAAWTGPRGIFADEMPVPDRRRDGPAHAERPGLVQGRALARRHALNVPGLWFMSWYDVSVGPNLDVQPRAEDGEAGDRRPAVGDHRAGGALRLHPRHREHRRRRAQHGRRPARLRRDRLRLLRPVPEGASEHRLDTLPKVTYFTMGSNRWQTSTPGRRRGRGR
jgi:uncharacterized protein